MHFPYYIRVCIYQGLHPARVGLGLSAPSWRWLTWTSVIIMVDFVNRATEVLKEKKGSRGYQGWTDWMPHAHWYGISLPCLCGQLGLPHMCGVCQCAS